MRGLGGDIFSQYVQDFTLHATPEGAPVLIPLSAIGMYLAFIYIVHLPLPVGIDDEGPGVGKREGSAHNTGQPDTSAASLSGVSRRWGGETIGMDQVEG